GEPHGAEGPSPPSAGVGRLGQSRDDRVAARGRRSSGACAAFHGPRPRNGAALAGPAPPGSGAGRGVARVDARRMHRGGGGHGAGLAALPRRAAAGGPGAHGRVSQLEGPALDERGGRRGDTRRDPFRLPPRTGRERTARGRPRARLHGLHPRRAARLSVLALGRAPMRYPLLHATGIVATLLYAAFVVWVYAAQPRTFKDVT